MFKNIHPNKVFIKNWIFTNWQKFWDSLVDSLEDLDQVCEKTADLRDVFANTSKPIYFDPSHISDVGNEIVAQEFYELTLPVIIKDLEN